MTNWLEGTVSIALAVLLGVADLAQAQTFTTLYNFTGGSDGGWPYAGIIQDSTGNLYGTAYYGGDLDRCLGFGCGVVYELNSAGTETVVFSFNESDGAGPIAPMLRDMAGNLYGTTLYGGSNRVGAVFKIDTAGNETVLHRFSHGSDGCHPSQGLVMDSTGNLFGTTTKCGSFNRGTIFEVTSAGDFTVLHSFAGPPSDGANPYGGHLALDGSGNLYGLTYAGGGHGYGALYRLTKSGTLTLLHSFDGGTKDGCLPRGSVVQDETGNFYGTTGGCGRNGYGTAWKMSTKGNEIILHHFAGGESDGCYPPGGVTRDSKGNLYGVTYGCGANNWGTVYGLSASGKLTLLHSFDTLGGNGALGELLRTSEGALFGTTVGGGTYGYGTAWKYVP